MRCCSGSCYIPEGLYHEPGAFVVLDISADLADDLWGSVAICRGTVVTNRKKERERKKYRLVSNEFHVTYEECLNNEDPLLRCHSIEKAARVLEGLVLGPPT
jgi:hypothetical protein